MSSLFQYIYLVWTFFLCRNTMTSDIRMFKNLLSQYQLGYENPRKKGQFMSNSEWGFALTIVWVDQILHLIWNFSCQAVDLSFTAAYNGTDLRLSKLPTFHRQCQMAIQAYTEELAYLKINCNTKSCKVSWKFCWHGQNVYCLSEMLPVNILTLLTK